MPVSSNKFNHASLCSGIGGFDLPAEWMGWNNIFAVEKDADCRKVLSKNFPDVNLYEDIKEFKGEKYKGAIDIISAGFPCQPFSIAGKQKSTEDDHFIWPEVFRIIKEIKPTFFLGENVPGIISLALDQVLSDLESEGYSCQTFVIPACGVNAIHRRDRVWIVAYSYANGEMRRSKTIHSSPKNERLQERNQIQFSSKSDKISPIIPSNTSSNGSQSGRETQQRTHGSGKEGRVFESEGKDILSDSNFHKHRTDRREKVKKESILGINRETVLQPRESSGADSNAPNSDDIGFRRYQREGTQEGSTSCGSASPNNRKQNGGGVQKTLLPDISTHNL